MNPQPDHVPFSPPTDVTALPAADDPAIHVKDPVSGIYRIQKKLGAGSFSTALLVAGPDGVRYALKAIRSPNDDILSRVRAVSAWHKTLTEPDFARIRGAGFDRDQNLHYFLEDYYPQPRLDEWAFNSRPTARDVVFFAREFARILRNILRESYDKETPLAVVLRDVSPTNIFVYTAESPPLPDGRPDPNAPRYGRLDRIVLGDLLHSQVPPRILTQEGLSVRTDLSDGQAFIGTKGFKPPEVLRQRPPDATADIHCLGRLLFFLENLQPPPDIEHLTLSPPLRRIPRRLRKFVERMLDPVPARRPQSWDEVFEVFDRELHRIDSPTPAWPKVAIAASIVLAVAAALLAGGALVAKRLLLDRSNTTARPDVPLLATHPEPRGSPAPAAADIPLLLPGTAEWDQIGTVHERLVRHQEPLRSLQFDPIIEALAPLGSAVSVRWQQSLTLARRQLETWYARLRNSELQRVSLADGRTITLVVQEAGPGRIAGHTPPDDANPLGRQVEIYPDQIDAAIFQDLPLDDRLRVICAARGPAAALVEAGREPAPPRETLYFLTSARQTAGKDLEAVRDAIDATLRDFRYEPWRITPTPPLPGEERPPPPTTTIEFPADQLRRDIATARRGLAAATQAPWWNDFTAIFQGDSQAVAAVLDEARAWELLLDRDEDEIARSLYQTEAFARAVRRLARERGQVTREILWLENFRLLASSDPGAPQPSMQLTTDTRDVRRHARIDARGGQLVFGPQRQDQVGRVGYLRVAGTFSPAAGAEAPAVVFLLSEEPWSQLEVQPTCVVPVGFPGAAVAHGTPTNIADGQPHQLALVFVGDRIALLIDDVLATSLVFTPAIWPAVGVRGVEAELTEVGEWVFPGTPR